MQDEPLLAFLVLLSWEGAKWRGSSFRFCSSRKRYWQTQPNLKKLGEMAEIKNAERFLSAQADHFAGAKWKEKAPACSVRNDGYAR